LVEPPAAAVDWGGEICRHRGDIGRSVAGCDRVGEGQVRDEGRRCGSERFHRATQTI